MLVSDLRPGLVIKWVDESGGIILRRIDRIDRNVTTSTVLRCDWDRSFELTTDDFDGIRWDQWTVYETETEVVEKILKNYE